MHHLSTWCAPQWIQNDVKWTKKTSLNLKLAIEEMSCSNEELFPSTNTYYQVGCAHFLAEHYKQLVAAFKRRLHPKYEEYQEDIVPKEFCSEVGVCKDGAKSLETTLFESQMQSAVDDDL